MLSNAVRRGFIVSPAAILTIIRTTILTTRFAVLTLYVLEDMKNVPYVSSMYTLCCLFEKQTKTKNGDCRGL